MILYCVILQLAFYIHIDFFEAFNFEKIVDSQEVEKLVERVSYTHHPASRSSNFLYVTMV